VCAGALVRLEDVVPEQVLPGLELLRRQIAHGQDGEHERVHRRVHERRRLAPPVVHQHVQGVERFDVMPPHAGNEDRIAGCELGDLRVLQRCGEVRKFREIRPREIDQADRLACRREVEWTDVKVLELFGRKQSEAPVPRNDARDVIRQIVMGGDARAIAQPDAHERLAIPESEIVLGAKARQARVDRRGPDIDCRRNPRLALARDFVEHRVQLDAHRLEIESGEVVAVEKPAADVGRAEHRVDSRVLVEASQICIGRCG
jgi:hypothetical protein